MQTELEADYPGLDIQILGVNGIGLEVANPVITGGRDLPWLQDVAGVDVWSSWSVGYRDVIILDGDNQVVAVFNLSTSSLAIPANFAALKQLFVDTATAR